MHCLLCVRVMVGYCYYDTKHARKRMYIFLKAIYIETLCYLAYVPVSFSILTLLEH